ncbi:MAG: carboxypeptidase-like regulatory domain-containing protein, partial [Bacteroidaceae bacterium]|nr:carboxypeptidase-like regulatory domain-containing protein [Bacteroidaceae bacterium]
REWDDAKRIQNDVRKNMNTYVPLDEMLLSNKICYTEVQLGAEYQPGVKYLNTKTKRFLANREAPIYGIQHTFGIKGFLGGDYNYNYTEFTLKKRFWLKSWGSIDAFHCASFQWNTVPYQLLCVPRANLSYIRCDNTFSLVRNLEFLNDRTFMMMYRWDLNGKLLNRIPLIKKLKWRETLGFNMMWGYLTDKNNPNRFNDAVRYPDIESKMADPGYDFLYNMPGEWIANADGTKSYVTLMQPMNSWKPYLEINVGIHNVLKFFSIDYYHRLTYNRADTQTWGLRFEFEASF